MRERLFISLLLPLLMWVAGPLRAAEVRLEEIPISLYNKPVTGYRFTLDRSQRFVEQQIMKHVGEHTTTKPFQYERTLIYENIRYAPVTDAQDISLYYLMRGYENHYTELTLVVMHDYRRSVSSRDFPALSLRVQIDLARLVRKTCGDILRSGDLLLDDDAIAKLKTDGPADHHPPPPNGLGEEEVERSTATMPRGGYKESFGPGGDPDSTIAALRRRVLELEAREKQYIDHEAKLRDMGDPAAKQMALNAKIAENRALKDSITMLNQRVQAMIGQHYVSDDQSISNETAEHIADLERENKRQQKLVARLERENDSLSTLAAQQATHAETMSRGRQAQAEELSRLRKENTELQGQLLALRDDLDAAQGAKSAESSVDSLLTQLKASNRKAAAQSQEMDALRQDQDRLRTENESLLRGTERLESRIAALESENRSLSAQLPNPEKPVVVQPTPLAGSADRDSLVQMRQRLSVLERQAAATAAKDRQIAEQENSLRLKDTEIRNLQSRLSAAESQASGSQAERKRLEQELGLKQNALKAAQDQAAAAKAEQERLEKERSTLNARLQAAEAGAGRDAEGRKALQDSLFNLGQRLDAARTQARDREDALADERTRRDSLQARLDRASTREQDLLRQSAALQSRIDSLARYARPETDQQRFIREQWARLDERQRQLDTRDKATADADKLSTQRTTALDAKERELRDRENALAGLEERERQIRLREQQADARESLNASAINPADIRTSRVTEFGSSVPVFIAQTTLNYRAAQKQVVAYMLSRDILLSEQFPDLVFRNAHLPELGEGQVEMKVRVDTNPEGAVMQFSFLMPGGSHLGDGKSPRLDESARQLIVRLLRYKY